MLHFEHDAHNSLVSIRQLENTERPTLGDPEAARLRGKVASNSPARGRARKATCQRPRPATYVTLPCVFLYYHWHYILQKMYL